MFPTRTRLRVPRHRHGPGERLIYRSKFGTKKRLFATLVMAHLTACRLPSAASPGT
jgi:hypothetical protein